MERRAPARGSRARHTSPTLRTPRHRAQRNGLGKPSSSEAFEARFGKEKWGALEQRYLNYLTQSRLKREVFEPPTERRFEPQVRVMTDAEVHLLWGMMAPRGGANALAHRELDRALVSDPRSAEVHLARVNLAIQEESWEEGHREVQLALERAPEDPKVLSMLFQLSIAALGAAEGSGHGAPPWAAIRPNDVEHLARTAGNAWELRTVAYAKLNLPDPGPTEALPFAEQAVRADPLCSRCFEVQAIAFELAHRLEDAQVSIDHAIALLAEEKPSPTMLARQKQISEARKSERAKTLEEAPKDRKALPGTSTP